MENWTSFWQDEINEQKIRKFVHTFIDHQNSDIFTTRDRGFIFTLIKKLGYSKLRLSTNQQNTLSNLMVKYEKRNADKSNG